MTPLLRIAGAWAQDNAAVSVVRVSSHEALRTFSSLQTASRTARDRSWRLPLLPVAAGHAAPPLPFTFSKPTSSNGGIPCAASSTQGCAAGCLTASPLNGFGAVSGGSRRYPGLTARPSAFSRTSLPLLCVQAHRHFASESSCSDGRPADFGAAATPERGAAPTGAEAGVAQKKGGKECTWERRVRPIKKLLVANRGEIAVRVHRACKELGITSVGIYSQEDSLSLHRQVFDESYLVGKGLSPVAAYLHYPDIIDVALKCNVDAIHPGYGFLSENAEFAAAVEDAGIMLVGPPPEVIRRMGDKVEARTAAELAGVQAVPGTSTPVTSLEEAADFCKQIGFPVMLKAAYGGGGRGMRRVFREEDLREAFERATSEAKAAFGNGAMFIEKLVQHGVHIEVQIMGDHYGNVIHFHERDCTVQRRHQKVIEIAPAPFLHHALRERILADAVRLAESVNYQNAGTVEFLVEGDQHYFIEVNARLQVEHTVSEEITGVDLVKTQLAVRQGCALEELGVSQEKVDAAVQTDPLTGQRGPVAIQCRITTEDSQRNFQPSTGRIDVYQPSTGPGIRLDGAIGTSGAVVTPFYDSLLVKLIAKGQDFPEAVARATRALRETKIRGVTTNIPFILNVLRHPKFLNGTATTRFVDENNELLFYDPLDMSSQNICKYLATVIVNGPQTQLVNADALPDKKSATPPPLPSFVLENGSSVPSGAGSLAGAPDDFDLRLVGAASQGAPRGYKALLDEVGPQDFAKVIRMEKRLLLCDTTLRDAHQSLLATRMRTFDMLKVAPAYGHLLSTLFSMECWGGATFDVAYRFLRESPWRRLELLREAVPNIPFQMLLRGANAVGYTAYPDNAVEKFCCEAVKYGMDVFRVFDSLNYLDNLKLGIDAAGAAGGVVEAAMSYTGDVADPARKPYTLDYYLDLASQLVKTNCHILCVKDMAGLLTPPSAQLLIGSLRREFPDIPIHVHTHDTGGCGVASLLAAADAGADIVDVAIDSLSGLTSQPCMGSLVSALRHTVLDTGLDLHVLSQFSGYFEQVRRFYAPFEATATVKNVSSEVYDHEIPGGQYTNLHMQAFSLGMSDKWREIKRAYVMASRLLGNPPKVTPSSKVVGDMAQFMVQNNLDEEAVLSRAESLSFPSSVVEYFQGHIGQPPFGFPEPLRTKVLKGAPKIEGRPGESLTPVDWNMVRAQLESSHGRKFRECDLVSSVLYPAVFDDYQQFVKNFGDVSMLPTAHYFTGIQPGETVTVHMAGREVTIKYIAKTHVLPDGSRDVFFEVLGMPRTVNVVDLNASKDVVRNAKADLSDPKQIASPMPGNLLQYKVKEGQAIHKGDPVAVITAMKMETVVVSPVAGTVGDFLVREGDPVQQGDLLARIQQSATPQWRESASS
ncbi:pyruvate carboxylase [Besnoitia besnoiti]|uniref:pyruvate carboxylase n=1 Tax=Besnoitia besnoiti TaxID=94643 RepID=A0A2A9M4K7_BESBE|nr:pyruvate carboxylase [Besnoitia besnoiti]PFH33418.1 pyruvate carboxylase [Besnoitia besnoiti]